VIPRARNSGATSRITTSNPARAATWAIPLPIVPAPTTPKISLIDFQWHRLQSVMDVKQTVQSASLQDGQRFADSTVCDTFDSQTEVCATISNGLQISLTV